MFIAIAFVCFVSTSDCRFIQDKEVTTRAVCEERNQAVGRLLDVNPSVEAYQTHCVQVHLKQT